MDDTKSERTREIQQWLDSLSADTYVDLSPASADASFRRYLRVTNSNDNTSYIVMDAPPENENCKPFIHVTELIRGVGVNAPNILALNLERGFLLLQDLGNSPYLDMLNPDSANALYLDAVNALIKMQRIDGILPAYDAAFLQQEMDLFETWYVERHLGLELDVKQRSILSGIFNIIIENAVEQPQVFVHRDYHSRNLMFTKRGNPGVIDYQDAMVGPISYDLVSLFKDCYIEWPRDRVEYWLDEYIERVRPDHYIERQQLIRWFDLMGVQRHIKVLGIFCRLNYRDGKPQYLDDLPLTRKYVLDTCDMYQELQPLKQLLLELEQAAEQK